MESKSINLKENLSDYIHIIRNLKVMLDSDLAKLYGVQTKILNKAVQRNRDRFPEDFMFQITNQEVTSLRFQIGTSNKAKGGRRYRPFVFTEQGVAMLSSVLKSKRAVQVNIAIMRAFVQMRKVLNSPKIGFDELEDLQRIQKIHGNLLLEHNDNIAAIFEVIREMEKEPEAERKKIGFM